ncbi:MAG: RNA-binding protein [Candidatus Korarchaeota archaeon]|nr:RNA-binding protein [Candidatus Korarchaeota archaeon]NIU84425.1 RNA-binding protein [Candidatus Thorarchaeota archaeon]NIW12909.1 RNA-binding protein [Candidatus Thorarchaeota archaeon]NIW51872.1 RNA-binding protein [Candidatus Korarchaeota archaeon]
MAEVVESKEDENKKSGLQTIYVGTKPLIRYVMAAIALYLNERPNKLKIAARGRAISRAVDVAEVLRTLYLKGILDVEDVKIHTDRIEDKKSPGKTDRVSSMEILLRKKEEVLQRKQS